MKKVSKRRTTQNDWIFRDSWFWIRYCSPIYQVQWSRAVPTVSVCAYRVGYMRQPFMGIRWKNVLNNESSITAFELLCISGCRYNIQHCVGRPCATIGLYAAGWSLIQLLSPVSLDVNFDVFFSSKRSIRFHAAKSPADLRLTPSCDHGRACTMLAGGSWNVQSYNPSGE